MEVADCDVHGQGRFDAIAREMAGKAPDVSHVLLDCDLRIRAIHTACERAALHDRDEPLGQFLFDAFPDDPNDPQATGASNLAASLETAMRSGHTHNMWIQRYDIRDPAAPDTFLPRAWNPSNCPLFDHGELVGAVHRVAPIQDVARALTLIGRAIKSGGSWPPAEVLHTLVAVSTAENTQHSERRQALVAEAEQLRRAIETRDVIGQAKGIMMERFGVDAAAAFSLLAELSQRTNTRVEQVARQLIDIEHPPR